MIARIWLALVAVPAVVIALFAFTLAANNTPSTLGGGTTPTAAATTPTTGAGTPTAAAATVTPATTPATTAVATGTTAALPSTGTGGASGGGASLLWLLGLVVAAVAVGGVLFVSTRRA